MRTVFHVSSTDAYRVAEAKVRNLFADESLDLAEVAVLVDHPEAVNAAAEGDRQTTNALLDLGATVKLCSNSVSGAAVGEDDFPEAVELVSSGVGELTRLQNGDWAYIRL